MLVFCRLSPAECLLTVDIRAQGGVMGSTGGLRRESEDDGRSGKIKGAILML